MLKNVIKGANAIVLLINGDEERFDESLQQMMREMQVIGIGKTLQITFGKLWAELLSFYRPYLVKISGTSP